MRESVFNLLKNLRGLDGLRRLFIAELNYDRANQPISKRGWPFAASNSLTSDPTIIAEHGDFRIIYLQQGDVLSHMEQRAAINELLKSYSYALFVFSNAEQDRWHFINVKYDPDNTKRRLFRRIVVGNTERLRTASERLAMINLETLNPSLFGINPLAIQQRHDAAFDVEAITRVFFDDYRKQFDRIKYVLQQYSNDPHSAHSYALQFINRLMFVYFVQRKGWLDNDHEFLKSFWDSYKKNTQTQNTFIEEWLNVLFFEAFNNKFFPRPYLPEPINKILQLAPYLNGGLFRRNQLDETYAGFHLSDADFLPLFTMLERYNFTIREDGPLDQEVSVDPEMIGKVYESLVNVTTEANERGDIGIFYTPRTEIDLMCRLTLVDYLSQRLGQRDLIYQFVFALDANEQQHIDQALIPQALWEELGKVLNEVKVIDPACGSGAFLVGMLNVLDQLIERANNQLGIVVRPSERKRAIIRDALYGVDIMDWAVDITELRLWLQLVVETDYSQPELKLSPLLPDLSFKIRQGDSLVQEIAGINFAQIRTMRTIPSSIQGNITKLRAEKLKAYQNEDVAKRTYKTNTALKQAELSIFSELFKERKRTLESQIQQLSAEQASLLADAQTPKHNKQRIEALNLDLEATQKAADSLKTIRDVPFIWDMAFVEIFHGQRKGFDIVIGNPPYVRQERIEDQLTQRQPPIPKAEYKNKLIQSVYQRYPHYFGLNVKNNKTTRSLNKKSDLYIYFFFHGLHLLNEQGCLGFVTSNSWLDVGYGADLQEFLLLQGHVRLMLDNKTRRTFANADVNSTIAILGAPQTKPEVGLANTARFVQFAVPFEAAFDSQLWQTIEHATERTTTDQLRVMPVAQQTLYTEGLAQLEAEDDEQPSKPNGYAGNKWGGKYLRAPDIYYRLLEKGQGKFVRLGNIADVRFGIKTGVNEFFYLDEAAIAQWGIEPRFLQPIIKSPKESRSMILDMRETKFMVFMCHAEKHELADTNALAYIQWGEQQKFHLRPSCKSRARWWDLGLRKGSQINCNYLVDKVMRFFAADKPFLASDNFQEIVSDYPWQALFASLNSTITQLMINTLGRTNFGDGLLKIQTYEVADLLVVAPEYIDHKKVAAIIPQIDKLNLDGTDRKILDQIVFKSIGLESEYQAVFDQVNELIEQRLSKARSLGAVQGLFERYAPDEDATK